MKIFIDPGHGGKDPGAVGPTGLLEKDVALSVARRLHGFLVDAGHAAALSRGTDEFLELAERARRCNLWGAHALVSIHCNAATNPNAEGFEVWTTRGVTPADRLGQELFVALGQAFPSAPGRVDKSDGDDDKEADFAVLKLSRAPAVLVELGFISHPTTEVSMRSPNWISAAASAIAFGVGQWIRGTPKP